MRYLIVLALGLLPGLWITTDCNSTLPGVLSAQSSAVRGRPAPGKFLVARRDLPDPNFHDAVILMVHYDNEGAMGLVINRQTPIPMSRVFEELSAAKDRKDPVFVGGPVARMGVLALVRSKEKPEDARHVFSDVYLVQTRALLEKTLSGGAGPRAFRVFMGYAGWGPEQLDRELEIGTWHVLRADAATVFDPSPDSVWPRLIQRTEMQLALRLPVEPARSGR